MARESVIIFDTTLRDGEQAPGAAMTIPEKVEIAHHLSRLGVDVIEAGFPISSPAQFEAVRRIVNEVKGPTICALARAKTDDIDAAGEALAGGLNTRIHTFIATSDIHLNAKFADSKYGKTIEEKRITIKKMAVDAILHAKTYTSDVEFSAEDAGRTGTAYLCEVVQAAIDAGATTINLPDTTGYCISDEYAELIRSVMSGCSFGANVVFSTHCHDDLGLAVANSLSGVQAGARQVECTINGIGERAGNAALEEIAMAILVRSEHFNLTTNVIPKNLTHLSKIVSTFSGFQVQYNKAIVGRNAFTHEAGIHQDGVLKARETYEIMRAEDVGQDVQAIRLGRHSGRHGLFSRMDKLGIRISPGEKDLIYDEFVRLADRKKEINDTDLFNLVHEYKNVKTEPHYKLERFQVSVGTDKEPEATVQIRDLKQDEVVEKSATGDGTIDALYRAIDHAVNEGHDLVSYSIRSVSEGADAFGEVTVLISLGGPLFAGKASSTDVIHASAEAYMNALNSLAAHRAEEESIQFVGTGIMQAFGSGTPE
ncbi:MAG: 2-isopropylmalate synthase [Bacteroidetes bacterium]|nr:2-isopropylmalate synthase [Bacteroidota bacterium]